jgi:hypothetical protein
MNEDLILLIAYGTVGMYTIVMFIDKIIAWSEPAVQKMRSKTRLFFKHTGFLISSLAVAFSILFILNGGFTLF